MPTIAVKSRGDSKEVSPLKPNNLALLRVKKRLVPMQLECSSSEDAGGDTDEKDGHKLVQAASIWREVEGPDAANADVKMNNIRRYFRAARALYEMQFQVKRPSAILKMKSSSYGLKSRSTFDALAALVSPLRAHQILDDWTGMEVSLFEEAYERFTKDFHAIAEQLPKKTIKDIVAFYYVWKKHGSCAKFRDSDDVNISDDFLPEPEPNVSSETLKLMDRLRKRQGYIQDYLDAARAMYSPQPTYASNHKRQKISTFGLQRVTCFHQGLKGLSPLRVSSVLDTWTPFEIRIFEVAIECYGKDFPRIADVINSKSCGDVVAFYYIWKNDFHYQVVKNRWERKDEARLTKKSSADFNNKCA
ncbi:unnamed protein product [Peronospora belbahrii]|uniref:SANT domain-containing protein n=1 Tax=Peronospora belbahrii TaxID=622444 RepID=A0AAU9KZ85_9STRA|nr:unnamed protein product [Peronospora belbahrii]